MPQHTRFWTKATLAIFLFGLATPAIQATQMPSASADEPTTDRAQSLFQKGARQFKRGEFQQAAATFTRAYELDPHSAIMFNIGRAYEEAGNLIKALESYRLAVGLDPSKHVKQQLTDKIKEIELFLRSEGVDVLNLTGAQWAPKGTVSIVSDPSGAFVELNGQMVGQTPLREFTTPQGICTVRIYKTGYRDEVREFTVIAGKTYLVRRELLTEDAPTERQCCGRPRCQCAESWTQRLH